MGPEGRHEAAPRRPYSRFTVGQLLPNVPLLLPFLLFYAEKRPFCLPGIPTYPPWYQVYIPGYMPSPQPYLRV